MKTAIEYLDAADPILGRVFKVIPKLKPPNSDMSFESIARIIVNQQLSLKAAETIHGRVVDLVNSYTPENLIRTPIEKLRSCGLSNAKATYIQKFAKVCLNDPNYLQSFFSLDDEAAREKILVNAGFGPWSSQIFLLFHLQRPDVFPTGDATLNKAISLLYDIPQSAMHEIISLSERWAPYRSTASLALWKWIDSGQPNIFQE